MSRPSQSFSHLGGMNASTPSNETTPNPMSRSGSRASAISRRLSMALTPKADSKGQEREGDLGGPLGSDIMGDKENSSNGENDRNLCMRFAHRRSPSRAAVPLKAALSVWLPIFEYSNQLSSFLRFAYGRLFRLFAVIASRAKRQNLNFLTPSCHPRLHLRAFSVALAKMSLLKPMDKKCSSYQTFFQR